MCIKGLNQLGQVGFNNNVFKNRFTKTNLNKKEIDHLK